MVRPHLGPQQAIPQMGVAIATKNEKGNSSSVPKCCKCESQHPNNYQGHKCTKKELQWRKLHNVSPQAPSGCHFTSKTISPASAANHMLEDPRTDDHVRRTLPSKCLEKYTDGNMFTLITTVQQIMTGLQTAGNEQDRFSVIMRAVYGLVMQK